MNYSEFFKRAFPDERTSYEYPCRLACGPRASTDKPENLDCGTTCESKFIDVPTGLGKTAAMVPAGFGIASVRNSVKRRRAACLRPPDANAHRADKKSQRIQGWLTWLQRGRALSSAEFCLGYDDVPLQF